MTTHDLNALAKAIHENAVSKGFWDEPRNTGEVFMLVVSELSEAQEAHRRGRVFNKGVDWWLRRVNFDGDAGRFTSMFESDIKDTIEDEIADAAIRILDWCYVSRIYINPFYESELSENFSENLLSATKLICNSHKYEDEGYKSSLEFELNRSLGLMFKISEQQGFDLYRHIELKMKYNATRERLHGKKY